MSSIASLLLAFSGSFRSRASLQMENLALRHQLAVYHRTRRRPRLKPADRIFWSMLSRIWCGWRDALVIVRPETVIAWRRRRFRKHWTRLTRSGRRGRPPVSREVRELIRRMSSANPLWGAPHIVGELRMIGIDVVKAAVEKYMIRPRRAPSPTWRAFLKNHIREIVVNERHLKRILRDEFDYYHRWRTHQSLEIDCPEPRRAHPVDRGRVVEHEDLGGLHHHYERVAA